MLGPRRAAAAVAVLLSIALPRALAAQDAKEACFRAYEDAQRLRKKNELRSARRELITCGGESCPSELRGDCVSWLAEVDAALPSVVFSVRSAGEDLLDVKVTIDGKLAQSELDGRAITLDPGEHRVRLESDGFRPVEQRLVVREGEKARVVSVELTPLPAAEPETAPEDGISTPVILLAALGAVGVGSFGFFAIKSHSAKSDLDSCKGHCSDDEVDAVRRDQIIADVSLGVGLVALGAAAYLHFGRAESETRPSAARWSIGVAPVAGGAALSVGREL